MSDFDENEFLDLPEDPELAFAALEQRMYLKVVDSTDGEGRYGYDAMREYLDTMIAFDEINELNRFGGDFDDFLDYNALTNAFASFREKCRRIAIRSKMRNAKKQRSELFPILTLDAEQRSAIHRLVEAIREQLNSVDLSENLRESLFSKLNAFDAEVDRNRTRTEAFFAFGVEASRCAREMGDNIKPFENTIRRLFDYIERAVKAVESLPKSKPQQQIEGPRED